MTGSEIRIAELKEVIQKLKEQLLEYNIESAAQDPLADESDSNGK
jgi:hypothetical protein